MSLTDQGGSVSPDEPDLLKEYNEIQKWLRNERVRLAQEPIIELDPADPPSAQRAEKSALKRQQIRDRISGLQTELERLWPQLPTTRTPTSLLEPPTP